MGENDLKQQLEILKSDKRQLAKEIEELKEKYIQIRSEREALTKAQNQWKTERAMLLKKIEMVYNRYFSNILLIFSMKWIKDEQRRQ